MSEYRLEENARNVVVSAPGTPLAGALHDAYNYFVNAVFPLTDDPAINCRNYIIVLVTDGAEECFGNPCSGGPTGLGPAGDLGAVLLPESPAGARAAGARDRPGRAGGRRPGLRRRPGSRSERPAPDLHRGQQQQHDRSRAPRPRLRRDQPDGPAERAAEHPELQAQRELLRGSERARLRERPRVRHGADRRRHPEPQERRTGRSPSGRSGAGR